jgi:hypothetical protein
MPLKRTIVALLTLTIAPALLFAERVELEKPVQISTVKADRKPLAGKLVAYDDEGFELARGTDKTLRVKWDELAAPGAFNVRSAIIGPKARGEQWIEVGRTMLGVDGGEPFAARAFEKAVKLDPKLQAQVDQAKAAMAEKSQSPSEPSLKDGPEDAGAADKAKVAAGPQMVGKVRSGPWPPLTEEQRAARVAELKKFAEEAGRKLNKELRLYETKYFLFYSDLPVQEAQNWAGLLDRMYVRLAELFGVERETAAAISAAGAGTRGAAGPRNAAGTRGGRGDYANVWEGKALVFVFQSADDYRRFQQVVHKTDAGGSAGMCHCFGDGRVHIAFFRQGEELTFAHVLVHESVHGFIHRFRTPATVPSWANEGLAEVIASELVPRAGRANLRRRRAQDELRSRGELGGMLDAKHIEPWQYPVAETLCAYMIEQNKRRYVDFVIGIKEGLTWEQSLEQRYKAPRERLVRAFRESLELKN